MPKPAANSAEAAPPAEKIVGRPFQPGQSGNPLGRPKGLARYVKERAGQNGELMIDLLMAAMGGWLPEGGHEPLDASGRAKMVGVPVQQRIEAAKLLLERGFGKAPQFAPIEDEDPLDLRNEEELWRLAAELDASIDELAAKRQKRERKPRRRAA